MKNPVTVASGTFGYGNEYSTLVDVTRLGAITVKGIRKDPCAGNPTPRIAEVPGGMLNAIGLQGPGVLGFIKEYMPFLRTTGVPVIVNIWGTTLEGYAETAAWLDGQMNREEAVERMVIRTSQLAKRQETWFRHQTRVAWVDINPEESVTTMAGRVAALWEAYGRSQIRTH